MQNLRSLLARLPALRTLRLFNCHVNDTELAALLELLPDERVDVRVHDADADAALQGGAASSGPEQDEPTIEMANALMLAAWLQGEAVGSLKDD